VRRRHAAIPLIVLGLLALGLAYWRAELIRVDRAQDVARPLVLLPANQRVHVTCDVVLPVVPVGMTRIRTAEQPLLIHYWAPWERHSRTQSAALDSLSRELQGSGVRIVMVAFDPFPSVARYVARQRLRVAVLLDGPGELRARIPCPRVPYTVVLDREGRVAVSQAGEVDWLAPETRRVIEAIEEEAGPPATSAPS
jgi:hypothetical protein